jgi:hypothetical protein
MKRLISYFPPIILSFSNLSFDLVDDNDPIFVQKGKKRTQLEVGDRFNSLQDFKDAVADLAIAEY